MTWLLDVIAGVRKDLCTVSRHQINNQTVVTSVFDKVSRARYVEFPGTELRCPNQIRKTCRKACALCVQLDQPCRLGQVSHYHVEDEILMKRHE